MHKKKTKERKKESKKTKKWKESWENVLIVCGESKWIDSLWWKERRKTMDNYWNSTTLMGRGKKCGKFISFSTAHTMVMKSMMENSPVKREMNHAFIIISFARSCDEFFIDLFLCFTSNALWVVQTFFRCFLQEPPPKIKPKQHAAKREERNMSELMLFFLWLVLDDNKL